MAVFPFLIVVTAIAGFIGSVNLVDEVAGLLFAAWPPEVASPLASEIQKVPPIFANSFRSSGAEGPNQNSSRVLDPCLIGNAGFGQAQETRRTVHEARRSGKTATGLGS
jgi:membrane protein